MRSGFLIIGFVSYACFPREIYTSGHSHTIVRSYDFMILGSTIYKCYLFKDIN